MRGLNEEAIYRVPVETKTRTADVRAVASEGGPDLTDLELPRSDAVDPRARDSFVRSGSDGRVRFTDDGYEVSVFDDDRVLLEAMR